MTVIEKARLELETSISEHTKIIIDMKHRLNQLTLIARLPPEVLTEVLVHFVSAESKISRYDNHRPYAWLRITHVCRYWRDVALSSPRVWSTIVVTGSSCVNEMLARSKKVPLEVYAGTSISRVGMKENIRTVLQQMDRIRRLELHYSPYLTPDDIPSAAPLLKTLVIKGVDQTGMSSPTTSFLKTFEDCDIPGLECLEIVFSKMLWTSPLLRPTLTSLVFGYSRDAVINASLPSILKALEGMPLLQHLDLQNVLPRVNQPHEVAVITRIVTLDRLSDLRITDWGLSCVQLVGHLSFPSSTTLAFDCDLLEPHTRTICCAFASKLTANVDPPTPLISVALTGEMFRMTRLKGWKDFQRVQDHIFPERVPTPHIDISLRLPSYHKIIEELFDALPLSKVQSLYVNASQVEFALPKEVWLKSFADMTQLRQLSVGRWAEEALADVLASRIPFSTEPIRKGARRRMQPFFPKLSLLQFAGTRLRDPYAQDDDDLLNRYRKAFQKRKKSRAELDQLLISGCFNFFQGDERFFKDVVKKVEWDGFEESEGPESGSEMYDDEELEDIMDDWEDEEDFMPWGFPGAFAGGFPGALLF